MKADNELAGDLFGDMVMEQAIQDKTQQYIAQQMAAQQAEVDAFGLNQPDTRVEEREGSEGEEDPDFALDEEEERMLRDMTEARIQAAREEYKETRTNQTLGHGTYTEITE